MGWREWIEEGKWTFREKKTSVREAYWRSAHVRAVIDSFAVLGVIVALDWLLSSPTSLRLAYVAPVVLATQRDGRRAGSVLVAISLALMIVIGYSTGAIKGDRLGLEIVVGAAVLTGAMLLADMMESRVRRTLHLATQDPLTGAFNRHAIESAAMAAIDRSLGGGPGVTLVMIDCDRLKELNDVQGHAYGDQALQKLVRVLERVIGAEGSIGRIGGDEFVLVLPGRDRDWTVRALEAAEVRFSDATHVAGLTTTFSYGLATVGPDGATLPTLMEAADRDMYRRKETKRYGGTPLARALVDDPEDRA